MEYTKGLPNGTINGKQGFFASLASFYRRWIVLEPTIFLFLVSGRMVYFTRANLFIDVSSFDMSLYLSFVRMVNLISLVLWAHEWKYQTNSRLSAAGWKTWPRLNAETWQQRPRRRWISEKYWLRLTQIRWVQRRRACLRISCCLRMWDPSYSAYLLAHSQTGAKGCLIFKSLVWNRYGRKLPLLLSCLGMSLTYAGYGILVTIDPKHEWVKIDPYVKVSQHSSPAP